MGIAIACFMWRNGPAVFTCAASVAAIAWLIYRRFRRPYLKLTRMERLAIDHAFRIMLAELRGEDLDIAADGRGERVIDAISKAILETRD